MAPLVYAEGQLVRARVVGDVRRDGVTEDEQLQVDAAADTGTGLIEATVHALTSSAADTVAGCGERQ